jgi:uncharacterized OB-fold protein
MQTPDERDMDAAARHAMGADGPYWNGLTEGRLLLPRCANCGRWHWPAVYRCGDCGAWDPAWHPVEMSGTIFSWTRTWHAFAGTAGIGVPYVTVVVEVPQAGSRRLLGVLTGDESCLAVGTPVRGEVGVTKMAGGEIPAIKWRIVQ